MKKMMIAPVLLLLGACWETNHGGLTGIETTPPRDFYFLGQSSPCYLELPSKTRSLRVNCFQIGGVLHIHSNRFAKWPRFRGESWVKSVRRVPEVRVQIFDAIYAMNASPIDDEKGRQAILHDRGYWYAWEGITVFRFYPR